MHEEVKQVMIELDYPFAGHFIRRKRKTVKCKLLYNTEFVEEKIAILGSSTISKIYRRFRNFLISVK